MSQLWFGKLPWAFLTNMTARASKRAWEGRRRLCHLKISHRQHTPKKIHVQQLLRSLVCNWFPELPVSPEWGFAHSPFFCTITISLVIMQIKYLEAKSTQLLCGITTTVKAQEKSHLFICWSSQMQHEGKIWWKCLCSRFRRQPAWCLADLQSQSRDSPTFAGPNCKSPRKIGSSALPIKPYKSIKERKNQGTLFLSWPESYL